MERSLYLNGIKRIVVKIGSNVLTAENGLDIAIIKSVTGQICTLLKKNIEVIIVSSGALAAGLRKLGIAKRPDETPKRQAAAAVGQSQLVIEYEKAFAPYNRQVAQILLTSDGLSERTRYLNARNTLDTVLAFNVIPIINENDTVAVKSIEFGDNDNLAAMITLLMDADILINLTDIDGLFDKDPRINSDAIMLESVGKITKEVIQSASSIAGELGKGGMTSKIEAAKKLVFAGIPMIIANGKKDDILCKIISGENCGTFFFPKNVKIKNRKRWIGYTLKPKGCIIIDDGAVSAIYAHGKSLLAGGIVGAEGKFEEHSPVKILNRDKKTIGMGLTNYGSEDIVKIMGMQSSQIRAILGHKSYDEVIHRDNLTITYEEIYE